MKNLIVTISFGLITASAQSMVWHFSDGTPQNIQLIHDNQAQDGDTILLPAGTFAWTSNVIVTKAITFIGQTVVDSVTGVCNDATVIQSNMPGTANAVFQCYANLGQPLLRITGITFTEFPGAPLPPGGTIAVYGTSNNVRFDHLHFSNNPAHNGLVIAGAIRGVADHIVEDNLQTNRCQNRVDNGGDPYGDQAWSQPPGFGGPDFFFFEDWYIDNTNNDINSGAAGWDSHKGAKFVVRHSVLKNVPALQNHGTEGGRERGGMAIETYDNDYYWIALQSHQFGLRSGSIVAHDNRHHGFVPSGIGLQTYRCIFSGDPTFSGASGKNGWDFNVTEADGVTHIDGHQSFLFDTGTISSAFDVDPFIVTVTGKNWTPNQWVSFAISRPSDGATAYIESNTNKSLVCRQWSPGDQHFAAGQVYEIRRVVRAIDQPGAGQSDLLSGATPTPAWPHQQRAGCYSWNNVFTTTGEHVNFSVTANAGLGPNLQSGLDYFPDTPLPGYAPYIYPHPLVTGDP